MNKQLLAVIGALVLAGLGFAAVYAYAQGAESRAFEGTELVPVLRATTEVPTKTAAATLAESVETVELPRAAVVEGAITDLASEIEDLLSLRVSNSEAVCSRVCAKATKKMGEIDEKIEALERMRTVLAELTEVCPGDGPAERCSILRALDVGAVS